MWVRGSRHIPYWIPMDIRKKAVEGGAYLVARQGLGVIISLGGVILLTRMIGPTNYGLYAGALAIILFLVGVGKFGTDVYLLRKEEIRDQSVFDQAFWFLGLTGLAIALLSAITVSSGVARFVDDRFTVPLLALIPTIPVTLMAVPMTASLERELTYRKVALIELSSQLTFYAVAVSLAVGDVGYWAPIAGYWAWQVVLIGMSIMVTRYRPRLVWEQDLLKDMIAYGVGYSSASWIWQLRSLVNPVIVGTALGPDSVAFINLAIRLVELLSMVKNVLWRLSLSVLGKVQADARRLEIAIREGMLVQVLAVGLPLALMAVLGPWIIPTVFGAGWREVTRVFPLIALSYLVNASFNMHSSTLYVLRENGIVAKFHALHIVLFGGAALLLVPWVGIVGYGIAELATVPAYWLVHKAISARLDVRYGQVLPWIVSLGLAIVSPLIALPWAVLLWLPFVVVATTPENRQMLIQYTRNLISRKM